MAVSYLLGIHKPLFVLGSRQSLARFSTFHTRFRFSFSNVSKRLTTAFLASAEEEKPPTVRIGSIDKELKMI